MVGTRFKHVLYFVFRPTFCLGPTYYCTFRKYLFVRLHNLDTLYRYANLSITKECVLNKIIYHAVSVFSIPPPFTINTPRVPKTSIFGGKFSKKRVKNINGSYWPTNLFKVLQSGMFRPNLQDIGRRMRIRTIQQKLKT